MTEADKEQQLQNWFAEMYNLLMFLKIFCIGSHLFIFILQIDIIFFSLTIWHGYSV